jgi:hypothetical protein
LTKEVCCEWIFLKVSLPGKVKKSQSTSKPHNKTTKKKKKKSFGKKSRWMEG